MENLKDYITEKQPFVLTYKNNGCSEKITVLYAQIKKFGLYLYLSCWAEESLPNNPIPQLAHNRFIKIAY